MVVKKKILIEGELFNTWARNRFKKNKNVLGAITGSTGSGKSYTTLSILENYYKKVLDMRFPIENCCFSLGQVAQRLNSGKLKKGEFLILEEAGANLGSLDFQNKLSKLFSYILQSFRSMNIGLILTLPVLTMLNKQARQLMHFHFITNGIDFVKEESKVKPYFHRLSQFKGKDYWPHPKIKHKGKMLKIKRLTYSKPSEELIKVYEAQKSKFVSDLTQEFIKENQKRKNEELHKESRKELTHIQQEVYKMLLDGKTIKEIAEIRNKSKVSIYEIKRSIQKKGYKC